MKFIMLIEEEGYEIRYWDYITETIGIKIANSWDTNILQNKLKLKGINIDKEQLTLAKQLLDSGRQFVILKSKKKSDLDILPNNFEIGDV